MARRGRPDRLRPRHVPDLDAAIDEYLTYLHVERGLSLGVDCSGAFVSSAIILLESLCLPDALSFASFYLRTLRFLGVLCG